MFKIFSLFNPLKPAFQTSFFKFSWNTILLTDRLLNVFPSYNKTVISKHELCELLCRVFFPRILIILMYFLCFWARDLVVVSRSQNLEPNRRCFRVDSIFFFVAW